jgi:hypothetical protein
VGAREHPTGGRGGRGDGADRTICRADPLDCARAGPQETLPDPQRAGCCGISRPCNRTTAIRVGVVAIAVGHVTERTAVAEVSDMAALTATDVPAAHRGARSRSGERPPSRMNAAAAWDPAPTDGCAPSACAANPASTPDSARAAKLATAAVTPHARFNFIVYARPQSLVCQARSRPEVPVPGARWTITARRTSSSSAGAAPCT